MREMVRTGYANENVLRELAIELARDIRSPEDILKSLNLTEEDYQAIKDSRSFQAMYSSAVTEWTGAGNTQKRVKLKAAVMTEEVLPFFYADLQERKESLASRVSLLAQLAKIGGLGQEAVQANAAGGAGFKLEIHLAGRQEPIIIDATPADSEPVELVEPVVEVVEPLTASSEPTEPTMRYAVEDYDEL